MTKLEDIEAAIVQLPREQFDQLAEWFDRQRETGFDRQIEADAKAGRLDACYARLESENAGQPDMPLGEFLRQAKQGRRSVAIGDSEARAQEFRVEADEFSWLQSLAWNPIWRRGGSGGGKSSGLIFR